MRFLPRCLALLTLLFAFTGCGSYINSPTAEAARAKSAAEFSHPLIARAYKARPAIRFPARLGIAGQSATAQQHLRALDAFGKLDSLKKLPDVAGFVTVSSLVMSEGYDGDPEKHPRTWNRSDLILREAAAKLHTDAVLLVQVETHITNGKILAPLSTFSLGFFPNNRAEIIATALAALVDTRTGFIYGTIEKSAAKTAYTMTWGADARQRAGERTARAAAQKLIGEFPDFWRGVVQTYRK